MELYCGIWGRGTPPFAVAIEPDARVEKLRSVIANSPHVDVHPSDITLYSVKSIHCFERSLAELIEAGAVVELRDYEKVRNFGTALSPRRGGSHIQVQIASKEAIPKKSFFKLPPEAIATPTPVGGENIDLRALWEYSQLEMLQLSLPSTLSLYLEHPLPFRVRIKDRHTAAKIFGEHGPEIHCDALSSLIDVLVMTYEAGLDEEDTKQSCQKLDDLLLAFTAQICSANGVRLKVERKDPSEDARTGKSLRSDLTVYCDGCLVLCGEEREGVADMNVTVAELQSKMKCWGPQFFGELPFILGYVACGNRRKLFAARFNHLYSICEVATTMAIQVFYNLAFLLSYMATKSKWTRPSRLSPFKPYQSETGTIELVDDLRTQITIRRDRCASGDDYKRIVGIYRDLEAIQYPPLGLQSVWRLKQTRFPSRKTIVQLSREGFYRLPENVDEASRWLINMLHALQSWHTRGYCHGDIRWENMEYVPYEQFIVGVDLVYRHPGYWMLVNLESSRRSSLLMQEQDSASEFTCQSDLFQLGTLMKTLEFPLTQRLLWIQQKLLSARDRTEEVTARRVLAMLNRSKKCQSDDVQSVANVILSALHTPEMTPESMLVMMKELVPPAQVKASDSSVHVSRPSRSLSLY